MTTGNYSVSPNTSEPVKKSNQGSFSEFHQMASVEMVKYGLVWVHIVNNNVCLLVCVYLWDYSWIRCYIFCHTIS